MFDKLFGKNNTNSSKLEVSEKGVELQAEREKLSMNVQNIQDRLKVMSPEDAQKVIEEYKQRQQDRFTKIQQDVALEKEQAEQSMAMETPGAVVGALAGSLLIGIATYSYNDSTLVLAEAAYWLTGIGPQLMGTIGAETLAKIQQLSIDAKPILQKVKDWIDVKKLENVKHSVL